VDALGRFRAGPDRFGRVVADRTPPQITGSVLARELLTLDPGLPMIRRTGFSAFIDNEKAKSVGICANRMNPFAPGPVAEAIRRALAKAISIEQKDS
jgi:DNA-binding NtrC family response regulator